MVIVPLYIREYCAMNVSGVMNTFNEINISFGLLILYVIGHGIPT